MKDVSFALLDSCLRELETLFEANRISSFAYSALYAEQAELRLRVANLHVYQSFLSRCNGSGAVRNSIEDWSPELSSKSKARLSEDCGAPQNLAREISAHVTLVLLAALFGNT